MSNYRIKNLQEIEDSASAPEIEARFARKHLDSRELGVSYFRYSPGFRAPMGHSHREQEEAYVVVAGSAAPSWTTRSSTSANGMSCAWLQRSYAPSKVARTVSSSSRSAPRDRMRGTACGPRTSGPTERVDSLEEQKRRDVRIAPPCLRHRTVAQS